MFHYRWTIVLGMKYFGKLLSETIIYMLSRYMVGIFEEKNLDFEFFMQILFSDRIHQLSEILLICEFKMIINRKM